METFADKLKRMREEKSLSQQELAQRIFVSRSAVAKWEQGRGFPSVASLQYIAAEFGVTIDELVSDKEIAILEIQKDKKLSLRTKLLIAMSVILSVIIAIGAVLLGMFYPRRLSGYIDVEVESVDEVYLKYFKNGEVNVSLDEEKIGLFMYYVKNIKIVPEYIPKKLDSKYSYCIKSGEKLYEISFMKIIVWEKGKQVKNVLYHIYSGSESDLLILFDVDLKYLI
ncbi:MAG: helix-turn-helix domain-containing protein [Clostridia bacterium]|nr:helix-turn-helix domain-containing protein [Clostridia bacterium]